MSYKSGAVKDVRHERVDGHGPVDTLELRSNNPIVSKVAARTGANGKRYQILMKLAVGGMAEIFLVRSATVTGVERYCALKRILPRNSSNAQFVEMFLNEARLATQLQHPNIASVYDIGMLEDSYFYTMEYVHGQTVRELARRAQELNRPLPLACVLTIIAGAAAGLHHAHERNANDGRPLGIVHRDVSPSNLMVSYEGNVKLVDFGIAKAADLAVETRSGVVKGKVSYLSPEQCRCERVDRRSDLFSLGIVAWEMLTGQRLYQRTTEYESMAAIIYEAPPPPGTLRSEVPSEVDDIVMRLLARSVTARFQTAAEVIEAIENASIRAGTMLSTAAVSRLMHDLFGPRAEPWLDLERARFSSDTASPVNRPGPKHFMDLPPGPPREAGFSTVSLEVSASLPGFTPEGAPLAGTPPPSIFEAIVERAAPPARDESVQTTSIVHAQQAARPSPSVVGSEVREPEPELPRTEPWRSPAATPDPAGAAGMAPWLPGGVSSAAMSARRSRISRTTVLLASLTLVATALGVIARSSGARLGANHAPGVSPAEQGLAVPTAISAGTSDTAKIEPAPDSSATVWSTREHPVPAGSAAIEHGAATAPPELPVGAAGAAESRPPPSSASTSAAVPPTPPAAADGDTEPRPPAATRPTRPRGSPPRAPAPSPGAQPPFKAIHELFEHKDYAAVVRTCREATMTARIADTCVRAACQVRATGETALWSRSVAAELRERLAAYCAQLRNGDIPTRSLDCSKDPLDCR